MNIVSREKFAGFSSKGSGACCFVQYEKEVLFLRKTRVWPGKYCVPGGRVEESEGSQLAALRELSEETKVQISYPELISCGSFFVRNSWGDYQLFVFKVQVQERPQIQLNDEHDAFLWATLDDARKLDLIPSQIEIIEHLQRKEESHV